MPIFSFIKHIVKQLPESLRLVLLVTRPSNFGELERIVMDWQESQLHLNHDNSIKTNFQVHRRQELDFNGRPSFNNHRIDREYNTNQNDENVRPFNAHSRQNNNHRVIPSNGNVDHRNNGNSNSNGWEME